MDRRRYPQQQYVPPGMVDFGQINFGHDIVAQQMPEILQNYQQRWDMQDAAIAKLLEEQAGTQMLEGDAQAVGNLLKSSFDEIDTLVKGTYQGDRGAAAMDIVKKLSAARAPLAQAKSEKERYDKAFEQYQNAAQRGQTPKTFVPGEGYKTLDFETYHNLQGQQAFGKKGYTPRNYNPLRGASDLSGYLDKGISKKLSSRVWQDILKENEKTPGYLEQITRKGYTGEQLETYFKPENFNRDQFIKELKGEVPHLAKEFEKASDEELFDYAKGIIKNQVGEQLMKDYKQNPGYNPNPNPPGPLTPGSRGKYTYTGRVTDEAPGSKFSNFVRSIIGGGKDEESLKEFIARRGHETSPLDPIQIDGKTLPSIAKLQLDYWTDLENKSREIPEGFTPEMMAVVDEFLKTDEKGRYIPNHKLVAGEVRAKLEHAFLAEQKRLTGLWEQLKADYNDVYKIVQSTGGTDSDFIEAAEFIKRRDDKVKYSLASWADVEEGAYTGESIIAKIPEETKLSRVGSGTKDEKGSVELKPETVKVNLYHGVIRAQNNKGDINEITSKDLPDNVAQFMDQAKLILQKATKYGKESSPDVLPYQEPIPGYSISAHPVIIYEFDKNTLSNKMKKIYVKNPHGKVFNEDGSLSDNVYFNPDESLIQYYYDTTDLSDYMMDKLSIVFNPYAKKQ